MNNGLLRTAIDSSVALIRGNTQNHGRTVLVDGAPYVDFATASYLGLDVDEEILAVAMEALKRHGLGRCASPLYFASQHYCVIERRLREILGMPGVMLFNSNTMANRAAVSLLRPGAVFVDEFSHRSILDAVRSRKHHVRYYRHRDVEFLEGLVASSDVPPSAVVTDGIFSMSGAMAPIQRLWELAQKYAATLFVDDAHGFAVTGTDGRGSIGNVPNGSQDLVVTGSLAKGISGFGGFVACSEENALRIQFGSPEYAFSCAIPDVYAAAAAKGLMFVGGPKWASLVRKLQVNVRTLNAYLGNFGRSLMSFDSPIGVVEIRDEDEMHRACLALRDARIAFNIVGFPAIPKSCFRLRFCISAAHSTEDINLLASTLERALLE